MNKYISLLVLLIVSSLSACAGKPVSERPESGILWVESSAEYDALTLQTYQNAARVLNDLIADKTWTALPGQTGMEESPAAIILDVDETALSNAFIVCVLLNVLLRFSIAYTHLIAALGRKCFINLSIAGSRPF